MSSISVNIDKKIYSNNVCAISNLDFVVEQSEFVAIVGPSGAGKTSLLNIIAGIDTQFAGKVLINGERKIIDKNNQTAIGFMFQDARLLPWMTVQQNIELVLGTKNDDDQSRMLELLQKVGLKDVAAQYPGQLSGGMRRRVSMVRAFVIQPQLLLMDEPFQSLDEPTARGLRSMLFEMWRDARPTILFVTHSLREALVVADRILFLSDKPARIILDYKVQAARPRQLEDEAITVLRTKLIAEHPDLLSGRE